MKHHFADLLDRDADYWTMVPNRERYRHDIADAVAGDPKIVVATISADTEAWKNVFTFPKLEELTLHSPSHEQLESVSQLTRLKRLRITHASPKDLSALRPLVNVEELVLEYVSGFSDLAPLQSLTKLKSLHLENLRRVSEFAGLAGLSKLRYLRIDGTLDWKQPIDNFEFLRGLPNLEVLSFGQVITKAPYPAFLPAVMLKKLKRLSMPFNVFAAEEYALMAVGLPGVEHADWEAYQRMPKTNGEWFEFTGKGAGRAKCGSPQAEKKCAQYAQKFAEMKAAAQKLLPTRKQS